MTKLSNYSLNKHEVKVSGEGISYFINDEQKVVLCEGKKPYLQKHIIVPETIEGKPVVAIGENAFRNAKFLTMNLPDSVLYVLSNAFYEAEWILLKMPRALMYLGNCFTYDDSSTSIDADKIIKNLKNEKDKETIPITDINGGSFPCYVSAPQYIEEIDEDYETNGNIIKESTTLDMGEVNDDCDEYFDESLSGYLFFDEPTMSIYGLMKDSTAVLFFTRTENLYDFPLLVNGTPLRTWDLSLFSPMVNVLGHFELGADDNGEDVLIFNHGPKESTIKIPEHVTRITNYFNVYVPLDGNVKIILPKSIKTISGI